MAGNCVVRQQDERDYYATTSFSATEIKRHLGYTFYFSPVIFFLHLSLSSFVFVYSLFQTFSRLRKLLCLIHPRWNPLSKRVVVNQVLTGLIEVLEYFVVRILLKNSFSSLQFESMYSFVSP